MKENKTKSKKNKILSLIPVAVIIIVIVVIPVMLLNYQAKRSGLTMGESFKRVIGSSKSESKTTDDAEAAKTAKRIDFLEPVPIGSGFTEPPMISHIQSVDLDVDGLLDVVLCDVRGNFVSWIRQQPQGTFTEIKLAEDIIAPSHAQIIDFDNDKDLDIMVGVLGMLFPNNDKIGSVVVLENDGECNFAKHVVVEKIARVSDVRAGDLNNDGLMDLVVAQFGYDDGETRWMENLGNWKFKSHMLQFLSGPINADINNYNELTLRGMMFFERGIYNEAKKYLSKAWELKSEDYEIFISLSYSLWKTGNQQKAEEILTQSAEKNLDNAENLAAITYAFLRIEKYEKAKYYLNRLKQLAPNHPRVQKISGKIAESNGDSMAAISMYESSFKGNPKDVETINSLGNLLIDKKLWVRFYQFYKEVISQNPNNPVFLEKWGTFYMACPDKSLRNLDEAIEYLNRAFIHISSPPHIVLSAGKNLSVALLIKRDKENALKAVNKTINYAQRNNAPQNVKEELEKLRLDIQNL